ncbi:MAG: DUF1304 domain-containing protein [Rhodanobacteraceae bacterium]|nr:DUF1304 domain-containing protein [Rhodanobacteraceae bacterium]HPF71994.1 DUF1304 domain-containing protein [Xanthomonadaceae bacterium]HRX98855.1 DUF1304 domain-containing protein [Xanthomonadaceae bacterium]
MPIALTVIVTIIALLHGYFLVLEMFLWTKPYGRRVFRMSAEQAEATRTLAANQGLYNGFLAAGLVWGLIVASTAVLWFFLICVLIAGLYGAATANRKILFVQALPAAIAIALLTLA